ncbi:FAD-dependent monooxygenase [Leucobacter allii]|uniref:FAD-dependent monooxygenase n=1 Tax=Leucobacter allii TaxID=2932247 RepID=UPI001FD04CD8|nr:FAD-dependent monooxygenase [Leucobacter allii]UOR01541.1 FAD-dependent monooxygenase [Leucobacter allii]
MQYYLDGFFPGDPAVAPVPEPYAAPDGAAAAPSAHGPDEVDVLIVGCGPAGLLLAAQLARFPKIRTRIVERKPGPLELGQADGIACRTVEMFEAFDLGDQLLRESYWVNETSFWRPSQADRHRIERTGRVQDVEDGLSEFPHVIVNQARIHDYLLGSMRRSATRLEPDYGLEFAGLAVDRGRERPVTATLRDVGTGAVSEVRARYVVGCDGARSGVRSAIGRELSGDRAHHAWGVMDILAVTDFPDIRLKAAIQSSERGSILLIPREGGYLVRLYVDLGVVDERNRDGVRAMTPEQVAAVANDVLHPYTLDVKEVAWFSVYEVAQRLTDAFDDAAGRGTDPRVFIAGDACHTHSAKAGQGMNVSMQDAFNLGWKLAAVLRGLAGPELLETYSAERQPVAQELIDFDREWSAMLAAPPRDPERPELGGVDPAELRDYFVRAGRYTAGVATRYRPPSDGGTRLTGEPAHQALASGFGIGTRFHSVPVTRIGDALRTELGHAARADGRWRVHLFADAGRERFDAACEWLASDPASPILRHTPGGWDIDAVIDIRGVVQDPHREVELGDLPELMRPSKGRYGLIDTEKAFSALTREGDAYDLRGVDRERGTAVIVRPDQYVAHVLPLDDRDGLAGFFAGALLPAG